MDDYLSYYGLSSEPFSGAGQFFSGAQRQELIEQLQHYCQFSSGVVVLEGVTGAGKSTVLERLAELHLAGQPLSFIAAPVMASAEQILASLALELGLPLAEDSTAGAMVAELRHQLQDSTQQALIIVDDAHNLDDQVLSALLSLLQGQESGDKHSNLVLSGGPGLAVRLDGFELVDVLINDAVIEPLSQTECRDYIDSRMELAGFEGETPFTQADIDRIWQLASGRPAEVNRLAGQALMEKLYRPSSQAGRLPFGHILLAVVLLGLLIFSYLYRDDLLGEDAEVGAQPGVVAKLEREIETTEKPEKKLDQAGKFDEAGKGEVTSADEVPDLGSVTTQSGNGERVESGEDERKKQADEARRIAAAELSAAKAAAQEQVKREAAKARIKQLALNKAAAASAAARPKQAGGPKAALSADENFLLALDEGSYVLQLLAASSEGSAKSAAKARANSGALKVYPRRRNGKIWYVVVQPGFATQLQARAAARRYGAGVWPREVADIKRDIAAYRGI